MQLFKKTKKQRLPKSEIHLTPSILSKGHGHVVTERTATLQVWV